MKIEIEKNGGILFSVSNSLFQALGLWRRSKKRAGEERDQGRVGSGREKERADFSLPDPTRRPPAFSIIPRAQNRLSLGCLEKKDP